MTINITFLRDIEHGGTPDQPLKTANLLADFINGAQTSLAFAIYDFRLDPGGALYAPVVNALKSRASAGVDIKIAYDQGRKPAGVDPSASATQLFLAKALGETPAQTKSITDRNPMHTDARLMHNKYILRDAGTPSAAVLTGSANFTDDAWRLNENNLVQISSAELAKYYDTDFGELWASGDIESTGMNDYGTVQVDGVPVEVMFSPGEGERIDERVARLIAGATRRIKIASMLISSHAILGALQDAFRNHQAPEMNGLYDSTQMQETIANWRLVPRNEMYIPMFEEVATHLASKASEPYTPTSRHNFMHIKCVVCDDSVFTGSFNFSHSATMNAENALVIQDKAIADLYSAYIDERVAAYSKPGG